MSVESIQKMVATYYQVRVIDLKSARRVKTLVRPRQVAMYLCRKHAGASYPELGSRFGDRAIISVAVNHDRKIQLASLGVDLRSDVVAKGDSHRSWQRWTAYSPAPP